MTKHQEITNIFEVIGKGYKVSFEIKDDQGLEVWTAELNEKGLYDVKSTTTGIAEEISFQDFSGLLKDMETVKYLSWSQMIRKGGF